VLRDALGGETTARKRALRRGGRRSEHDTRGVAIQSMDEPGFDRGRADAPLCRLLGNELESAKLHVLRPACVCIPGGLSSTIDVGRAPDDPSRKRAGRVERYADASSATERESGILRS
jgi:hypothetical protein